MEEFVAKYPDHEKVYGAFDYSAQLLVKEEKIDEAVKTYENFITRFPQSVAVPRAYLAIANNYKSRAEKLGPYLSLSNADQEKWTSDMDAALKNVETGIEKGPESDAVSNLLDVALKIETLRLNIGLRKAEEVEGYFKELAAKFDASKGTKAKILFALAGFLRDRDKEKKGTWFDIMDAAYDPELVYSPSDLDAYGNALIDRKSLDKAKLVFEKLSQDYPIPAGGDPTKVTRTVGDAQSVALAGRARVLRSEGKASEGQAMLEELKKNYPWSAKVAEADFGIGAALFEQKKYDEAISTLADVAKKVTAPVPLRARAMMLLAKSLREQKAYNDAINNFIKIATFFESEADLAAEGLYEGAQLLEQQAAGKIPLKDPVITVPKGTPGAKKPGGTPKPGASPKPGSPSGSSTAKK
jgi:TolA-binding protein